MKESLEISRQVAQYLLQIKAVVLQPQQAFTWASGIKSPIYCDNRLILSYPKIRTAICESFVSVIKNQFPDVNHISGVATGGIAQAALIANALNLPMSYIRPTQKGHGRKNQVEGFIDKDAKILVIEDLISTGGSSLQAIDALKVAQHKVAGLLAIFTYGFEAANRAFSEAQIPYTTLTQYDVLIEQALEMGYIKDAELQTLAEWRTKPETWGK